MDLLLLQPRQGLHQRPGDGGRQPRGVEVGGLHRQDQQHLGPVRLQGQGAHWGLCHQEKQFEGAR